MRIDGEERFDRASVLAIENCRSLADAFRSYALFFNRGAMTHDSLGTQVPGDASRGATSVAKLEPASQAFMLRASGTQNRLVSSRKAHLDFTNGTLVGFCLGRYRIQMFIHAFHRAIETHLPAKFS